MFTYFQKRREIKAQAKGLYEGAVAQARLPIFYENYGVPDNVDGRFEMIALHCFVLMHRLQAAGEERLSQALFDVFFVRMDRSLREMGVGDLAVPKHMKRMMNGFNGRADNYESALLAGDKSQLKEALVRNVYGTVDRVLDHVVEKLADYVMESAKMKTNEAAFAPIKDEEKKSA